MTVDHPLTVNTTANSAGINNEESAIQGVDIAQSVLPGWLVDSVEQKDLNNNDNKNKSLYNSLLEVIE